MERTSEIRQAWHRFRQAGRFLLPPAAVLLILLLVVATFANVLAPYDPTQPVAGAQVFQPPFWMEGGTTAALLGTDFQGRDVLSRIIYGARVSLGVAILSVLVGGIVGASLGFLAGYSGGLTDAIVGRLADLFLVLCAVLLAVLFVAAAGQVLRVGLLAPLLRFLFVDLRTVTGGLGFQVIVVVGAVLPLLVFTRQVLGITRNIRRAGSAHQELGTAPESLGVTLRRAWVWAANSVTVLAVLLIGYAIILKPGLSFLGVGLPFPTTPHLSPALLVLLLVAAGAQVIAAALRPIPVRPVLDEKQVAGNWNTIPRTGGGVSLLLGAVVRRLFPSAVPALASLAILQIAYVISLGTTLSFLGVARPSPAWGLMLAEGRQVLLSVWWVSAFPSVVIPLTVLSIIFLGHQLGDRLDPGPENGKVAQPGL